MLRNSFVLIVLLSLMGCPAYADSHDLSGNTYPIGEVSFNSDTRDKTEKILDKIDKANKDNGGYYDKIVTIEPKKVDGQYCYVKVIIKQSENTIIKEEVLECADGRKKFDGPSYWDLFAEFYYTNVYTPEYCRYYSRSGHAFKSPGKVCLNKNGEWEVK